MVKQEIEVRPLTKQNKDGETYERLPEVEEQFRAALALDRQVVIERITIRDKDDKAFLQEECLVH